MNNIESTARALEQRLAILTPSIEQRLQHNWPNPNNSQLWIKRDDLIHPIISGNKWRKLKYNLAQALINHKQHIVSFGGGYSNHLHALGYSCQQLGIRFTAIVRGHYPQLTPMLDDLARWQSDIHFVDKHTYQQRAEPSYLQSLQQQFPEAQIIAEGGSEHLALRGIAEILPELQQAYDYILLPVASGGTLAGLVQSQCRSKLIGIAVLKGQDYLESLVEDLLPESRHTAKWQILHGFHQGGYAKIPAELKTFCQDFSAQSQVPLEPVYSGKLLFAAKQLVAEGYFANNSKVLVLHTGGLQGQRG